MKHILVLVCLMSAGCSSNWSGAKFGDKVRVTSGFYKGCIGVAKEVSEGFFPCQFTKSVNFHEGNCSGVAREWVSSCDLEVVK